MGVWLSSCSEHDKTNDPKPTTSVSHNDVALPEVVVIGHREQVQYTYIEDYNSSGGFSGGSGGGGSGGGGGGGNGGNGGINPDGSLNDPGAPFYDPNNPNPNPPADIQELQVITSKLNGTQDLRVVADVRNGEVNGATVYISGLTLGETFTQDGFSPVSSTTAGDYQFQVAWHASYQLFVEGIGTVRVGAPFVTTVTYDAGTNTTTVKTVAYP